jgi:16S rRNA (uracil1498-N3)-methyltransferase
MHYFFSSNIIDSNIHFDPIESTHMTKVLRRNVGDEIYVLDGKGKAYKAQIQKAGKHVEAKLLGIVRQEVAPSLKLTIAVSPTKSSDRMEWMVEKLTEIGISDLVFIETEKGERSRINSVRLAKKAISALTQSGNLWLPEISVGVKYNDFLSSDTSDLKFIAHCFESEKTNLPGSSLVKPTVSVMIGPEGDFSITEIEKATARGFKPLTLGGPRYRTETAAIVACTLVNHFYVTLSKNN